MVGSVTERLGPNVDFLKSNGTNVTGEVDTDSRDAYRVQTLMDICSSLPQTHVPTLVVSIVSIVILIATKEFNSFLNPKLPVPIPAELITIVAATLISSYTCLNSSYMVSVVGDIPSGLSSPRIPDVSLFGKVIGDAFALAIVGYAISISLGKTFALKHGYKVDSNQVKRSSHQSFPHTVSLSVVNVPSVFTWLQELVALGLSNTVGGFFQCYSVCPSMSRSLIQETTGGKTQMAAVASALIVLVTILKLGPLFQELPKAVLSSIVFVNLKGMFKQHSDIVTLWKSSKTDLVRGQTTPAGLNWDQCLYSRRFVLPRRCGSSLGCRPCSLTRIWDWQHRSFLLCLLSSSEPKRQPTRFWATFQVLNCMWTLRLTETRDGRGGQQRRSLGLAVFSVEEEASQDSPWDSTGRDDDVVEKEEQSWTERENGTVFVIPTTPRTPEGQSRWEYLKGGDQDCTSLGWMSELQDGDTTTLGSSSEDTLSHDLERVSLGSLGKWTWDIHSIIIDLSTANFIDTVATKTIKNIFQDFSEIDVDVYIAGCQASVVEQLEVGGFFSESLTKRRLFATVHDAVLYCLNH
ncbi:unnamed protein product, partial [Tetraodon nigroviridis]